LVALAVVVHDTSDGLNTILLVTHGEKARRSDIVFLVADALAPVAGALLALILLPPPRALIVFLGFASGFFLYTATSDLLRRRIGVPEHYGSDGDDLRNSLHRHSCAFDWELR